MHYRDNACVVTRMLLRELHAYVGSRSNGLLRWDRSTNARIRQCSSCSCLLPIVIHPHFRRKVGPFKNCDCQVLEVTQGIFGYLLGTLLM